jgi:quercetin dioxygenase-like cupin family protein
MSITHASSGQVIDVRPLGAELANRKTTSLFKSEQIEVLRLILPAGKVIAEHKAPGEITVHCLEGRVAFTAAGNRQELSSGHMLYLTAGEPHALEALEDSSVLVTLALRHKQ